MSIFHTFQPLVSVVLINKYIVYTKKLVHHVNGREVPDILFWPSLGGPAGGANEYPCMARFDVESSEKCRLL
jgi:hypothetical protein